MRNRRRGRRVPGLSSHAIRAYAIKIRRVLSVLGAPSSGELDILEVVENLLVRVIAGYEFTVLDDAELGQDEGRTYPDKPELQLSNTSYRGALAGLGRCRFTTAHEVGHLFLHRGVAHYSRGSKKDRQHEFFEDSEWQADAFAAELLMPYSEVKATCKSAKDIKERFGVSGCSANIRFKEVFKA